MNHKEIHIRYTEYENMQELSAEDRELASMAVEATVNSYAPYSEFHVGAAVRLTDGTAVTGANQENIAYPSGLCAERTAMFYAAAKYPDIPMETIAIAASSHGELCREPATPCGACRQAPQGVAGSRHSSPCDDAAMAMVSIGMSGYFAAA